MGVGRMSNSIWKTGDPVYRDNRFDEIIVREYKRWAGDGVFYLVDDCSELPNRWAYLLDIIAQADKAERLQKGLNAIFNIMDKSRCQDVFTISNNDAWDVWGIAKGLKPDNEIKQLIKGK